MIANRYSQLFLAVRAALPALCLHIKEQRKAQQEAITQEPEPLFVVEDGHAWMREQVDRCLELIAAGLDRYKLDLRAAMIWQKADPYGALADFQSADSPQLARLLSPIGADLEVFKKAMRRRLARDIAAAEQRRHERKARKAEPPTNNG